MRIFQNRNKKTVVLSILVILSSLANFINMDGSENIRPIRIATLILCGMGAGVALMSVINLARASRKEQKG